MSNELKLPLFVRVKDCGDMKQYDSIAAMQNDLEEIDVENGEYEAWDQPADPLRFLFRNAPPGSEFNPKLFLIPSN